MSTEHPPRAALDWRVGGLGAAFGATLVFPWTRMWLIAPLDLGQLTLVSATRLPPGVVGTGFGVLMVALSLLLPTHPGAPTRRGAASPRLARDSS